MNNICEQVQKLCKLMTCVANSVKLAEEQQQQLQGPNSSDPPKRLLGAVMSACMNSSTPPVVRAVSTVRQAFARAHKDDDDKAWSGAVHCSVTGALLEDSCVEVRASCKVGSFQ